jgi:hypothetical protein
MDSFVVSAQREMLRTKLYRFYDTRDVYLHVTALPEHFLIPLLHEINLIESQAIDILVNYIDSNENAKHLYTLFAIKIHGCAKLKRPDDGNLVEFLKHEVFNAMKHGLKLK